MKPLPQKAQEYIREHYPEAQLSNIEEVGDAPRVHYHAELMENDQVIHLRFNNRGGIMAHDEEPRYYDEFDQELFYGSENENTKWN